MELFDSSDADVYTQQVGKWWGENVASGELYDTQRRDVPSTRGFNTVLQHPDIFATRWRLNLIARCGGVVTIEVVPVRVSPALPLHFFSSLFSMVLITDSVVVARILNATLVVPVLDHKSYWHDPSNFSDIFDVEKFISALTPDVTVINELPFKIEKSVPVYPMRIPRKATPFYYENRVLPKLLSRQVIQLTKFDYRLSNRLEHDLQKLRCRVNYHALHFTSSIGQMGRILVERMRGLGGRYIALHLSLGVFLGFAHFTH
ncbi:hypothetical protein R1flu_005767 [Riccia fluitans]|uniref:O-fucosyltransferase family protein n=1 Tax=Riccia fluitans TaxID=41844 RepID=A0ABD1YUC4_9MARC